VTNRPLNITQKKKSPGKNKMYYPRKRRPYWNFFRVVLAGWMIRYPKQTIFIPLGFLLVMIYNIVVK
jgi:hypothetical protein